MNEQEHRFSMPAKWARSFAIGLALPLGAAVHVGWQVFVIYALIDQIRHIG